MEETETLYSGQINKYFEIQLPEKDEDALKEGTSITGIDRKGGPVATFTGDFFTKDSKNNKYKKANVNDEKNKFFKALNQLTLAADVLRSNTKLHAENRANILLPLIVTNAEICVVNYEKNEIYTAPWVIHRNSHNEKSLGYMPYVVITTVEKLPDCIDSNDYKYPENWKKEFALPDNKTR